MSGLSDALFVSDKLHQRDVTLPDGSVHALHFRELPAVEFRKFYRAERSDDDAKQAGSMAALIAASLCEPDGKPAITIKKALTLNAAATNAIMSAILDVNGFNAGNPSAPGATNGSGTSSPSHSADEQ
jgi:hypothetical protein